MAFTGTPVVEQVSDSIVRITGVSLGVGATGTIGLFENSGTPGVRLPEAFKADHYVYGGDVVTLQASIKVTVGIVEATADFTVPSVAKTGTTNQDWLATISNTFGSVSGGLEIYVEIHN